MSLSELYAKYGSPVLMSRKGSIIRAIFVNRKDRETAVYYSGEGTSYVLYPPYHLTIHAYRNPRAYAQAALNGVDNPFRLNPADLVAA